MSDTVSWIALVISVASVCFTGLASWTSHQKLRFDLYNRRFDIYSRTLDFYHALLAWEPTDLEKTTTSLQDSPELRTTQRAFIKAKQEARFLFREDSGIQKQLEQMHDDTIGIIGYKRDRVAKLNGQTKMMISEYETFAERLNRINGSIPLLEQQMSEYLDFRAIGLAGKIW